MQNLIGRFAGLAIITCALTLKAQTLNTLHYFDYYDGDEPSSGLVVSGNTLYGTAKNGGITNGSGWGAVFAVNTDGTGYTILHSFDFYDGNNPVGTLVLCSNTLYGTTESGGLTNSSGLGTVFAVNTDGTGFKILHSFMGYDGETPSAGLVLAGNTLYGTTQTGGITNGSGWGTVFAINTDGTGFNVLHSFDAYDGANPMARLTAAAGTLYGTTENSFFTNSEGFGSVFSLSTNGTGFTTLHFFDAYDGDGPVAGLTLSGGTLYGTTENSFFTNSQGFGTVFAINTNGTSFTNLHFFNAYDGDGPAGDLTILGNTLYGTTENSFFTNSQGFGVIFAVNTDGSGFKDVHYFDYYDGQNPAGNLVLSGNALYGVTENSGFTNASGFGTVYSLVITVPPLNIALSADNSQSVLFWPAAYGTNFALQQNPNLGTTNWVSVPTNAVPIVGYVVTNTTPYQFFRLQLP